MKIANLVAEAPTVADQESIWTESADLILTLDEKPSRSPVGLDLPLTRGTISREPDNPMDQG